MCTNSAYQKAKGGVKMSYPEKLRFLRGSKTQAEVAKRIGITPSSWAMYERGERVPRDDVKILIAKYFGKTVQEIFFDQ